LVHKTDFQPERAGMLGMVLISLLAAAIMAVVIVVASEIVARGYPRE
jgi:hypothetical protein